MTRYVTVIGRAEPLDIVGVALGVPAKIDSGAFRSSLHATNIKVSKEADVETLSFVLLGHPCSPVKRPQKTTRFTRIAVKSSNGHVEERYEVVLKIKVASKIFNASFTLADRSNNVYPILVGRKALKGRFIVDVMRTGVNRMQLKRSLGIRHPEDEEDLEA